MERRGEFAVRGGIVDVFPPTDEHPLRVELWGDTVEEVRWFKVADQRSLEVAEHGLWAPPCRELLLTDEVRERAGALAEQHPGLADVLGQLAEGIAVEGMESLAPILVDDMELLLDSLPGGSLVVLQDPERVRTRSHDLVDTSKEFLEASWANAAAGAATPIDLGAAAYRSLADVRARAGELGMPWWSMSPFAADEAAEDEQTSLVDARSAEGYRGDTARALADVKGWLGDGYRVVDAHRGPRLGRSASSRCSPARTCRPGSTSRSTTCPTPRSCTSRAPASPAASSSESMRLVVLTETDLLGQTGPSTQRHAPDAQPPAQHGGPAAAQAGDFIVHEQHGVGRYVEMVQRTVQDATREYLVIEYAPSKRGQPGDRLFVPTDQLDQVTRYVGGEQPALHRLGGADWQKAKGRARKAVKEIAAELIRLYAARTSAPGFAFSPDTPWQRELEDAFPYHETPDQLGAIDEVKADMEKTVPMDRIVCGDVGYGKTEIAVRAAFKAVQDGKQVAVLVPTTLLVNQHLSTFAERYASFPVNVAALSRFQTDKEAERGQGRPARRQPSTWSSAPIACSRPRCSSRTSAWSSSTRSSASGSSTRSSSSTCAPTWTSSPCRPPRSRARWRWRSPASARCRRSSPRRRSGTPS